MANKFSSKALALRDEIAAELKQRPTVSALAQAKSFGSASECDLAVGAGTVGGDNFFLRIKTIDNVFKDVLGLDQQVYANHVAQLVFEEEEIAATAEARVGTWNTRIAIIGMLAARGLKIELYLSANGTAPVVGSITGAPNATFEPLPQYALMGSM